MTFLALTSEKKVVGEGKFSYKKGHTYIYRNTYLEKLRYEQECTVQHQPDVWTHLPFHLNEKVCPDLTGADFK